MAQAQYGASEQALHWVEATLTRLYKTANAFNTVGESAYPNSVCKTASADTPLPADTDEDGLTAGRDERVQPGDAAVETRPQQG